MSEKATESWRKLLGLGKRSDDDEDDICMIDKSLLIHTSTWEHVGTTTPTGGATKPFDLLRENAEFMQVVIRRESGLELKI